MLLSGRPSDNASLSQAKHKSHATCSVAILQKANEMTRHTKGHWIAVGDWIEHEDDDVPDIANFNPISMGQERRSSSETNANALLCAAAPGMLEVLQAYIDNYEAGAITNQTGNAVDTTEYLARLCYKYLDYLAN